jgi:hypothetical protein
MTKVSATLITLLIAAATCHAQYYSETSRQRGQVPPPKESLYLPPLPPPPPDASYAPIAPPPQAIMALPDNLEPDNLVLDNTLPLTDSWAYHPEPYVDNLPPHLARFLGMLLYYSNGSVFIVYTNDQALHFEKGLRNKDRILSINGKNVAYYKNHFLDELNEVRAERKIHMHAVMGDPPRQRILILNNVYLEDKKLDQLCLKLSLGDKGMWSMAQGKVPELAPQPPSEIPQKIDPTTSYKRSRRQFFEPILNNHKATAGQPLPVSQMIGQAQLLEMFGMTLAYHSNRLEVMKVAEGTASANAKVKVGDDVIQLGERTTISMQYDEIVRLGQEKSLLVGWKTGQTGRTKFGKFHKRSQPSF